LGGDDSAVGVALRFQMSTDDFDSSTLDGGTTLSEMGSLVPDTSAHPNQTWNNHNHHGNGNNSSQSTQQLLHLSGLSLNKPKQMMQSFAMASEHIPILSPNHIETFDQRVSILVPILTACYTHHGGSKLLAVEGLTKLLTETHFLGPDV